MRAAAALRALAARLGAAPGPASDAQLMAAAVAADLWMLVTGVHKLSWSHRAPKEERPSLTAAVRLACGEDPGDPPPAAASDPPSGDVLDRLGGWERTLMLVVGPGNVSEVLALASRCLWHGGPRSVGAADAVWALSQEHQRQSRAHEGR